jgi:hypothetical protein
MFNGAKLYPEKSAVTLDTPDCTPDSRSQVHDADIHPIVFCPELSNFEEKLLQRNLHRKISEEGVVSVFLLKRALGYPSLLDLLWEMACYPDAVVKVMRPKLLQTLLRDRNEIVVNSQEDAGYFSSRQVSVKSIGKPCFKLNPDKARAYLQCLYDTYSACLSCLKPFDLSEQRGKQALAYLFENYWEEFVLAGLKLSPKQKVGGWYGRNDQLKLSDVITTGLCVFLEQELEGIAENIVQFSQRPGEDEWVAKAKSLLSQIAQFDADHSGSLTTTFNCLSASKLIMDICDNLDNVFELISLLELRMDGLMSEYARKQACELLDQAVSDNDVPPPSEGCFPFRLMFHGSTPAEVSPTVSVIEQPQEQPQVDDVFPGLYDFINQAESMINEAANRSSNASFGFS